MFMQAKLEHKNILGRGMALALAMERWSRGGLWVISRGDPEYPRRLKRHLKHAKIIKSILFSDKDFMKFLYLDTVNMVLGNFSAGIPVHIVVMVFRLRPLYVYNKGECTCMTSPPNSVANFEMV